MATALGSGELRRTDGEERAGGTREDLSARQSLRSLLLSESHLEKKKRLKDSHLPSRVVLSALGIPSQQAVLESWAGEELGYLFKTAVLAV